MGTGFSSLPSQDTVKFNGTTATITSASPTQIVAAVPTGATTGTISVTTPSGTATSSLSFTVTSRPLPGISGFTPAIAAPNALVTITGSNFDSVASNDTVKFNGTAAPVYSASATTVSTSVPAQAGSGKITVQTAGGTATSSGDFFVVPSSYTASSIGFTGRAGVGASTSFNTKVRDCVRKKMDKGTVHCAKCSTTLAGHSIAKLGSGITVCEAAFTNETLLMCTIIHEFVHKCSLKREASVLAIELQVPGCKEQ